ncbi:asparagine synthase (glutamine-hydrolyzing) [Flavobacterium sp.]|uniref:asparagine synthase (glutamine-hydrolyzing) n=1 Tax=Flavobacterium sp. TaxID=239 RepID=UPI0025D90633|nr:asparagine synthase (glutamine-hydrolyzing) [Flavobacterium sp.]
MCGFTGYYYFNDQKETNNHAMRQMLSIQKHRGPNDSGIVGINTHDKSFETISMSENVKCSKPNDLIFGFNRLSILDLSPMGHQPMVSPNEKVILMLNGEIYNAFDFKEDLEKKGYTFKSTSDTEIVLCLYLEYGMEKMISLLNGMFAIAIYDLDLDTLFLVRDRFGIKPLYILQEEDRLAFSSEIKSFKGLPNFKFEPDFNKLDEFLLFRNVINDTLFKNITNCIPGTYLSIKNGKIKTNVFYELDNEGSQTIQNNAASILENALQKSVDSQMISDVKLGCQLSGGVDSSLVSYYASKSLEKGNLETVSIIFKDPNFSEEKYIDIVAKQLSLEAHKYEMNAHYYFEVLENAIWHFEHPLNHPNTIGIYLLSQEAKKHVTVLLSGEGADECLAGYGRFSRALRFPYFKREFLGGLKKNSKHIFEYLSYYVSPNKRMIMETAFGSLATVHSLKSNFKLDNAINDRIKVLNKLKGNTNLKQRKYELLTYLPDLLMRQDKMSMAHSIENRVPFLDNEMVTTSLNIPSELLVGKRKGKNENKILLKDICASKFGESFAYRDKMGFGIPLREFFSSAVFKEKWNTQVAPGIRKRGLFELNELDSWLQNSNNATSDQLDAIWLMLGFELWAQHYLD